MSQRWPTMSDTPAIEALENRRRHLRAEIATNLELQETYQGYVDRYGGKVSRARADLADIDRAVKALSYPDE